MKKLVVCLLIVSSPVNSMFLCNPCKKWRKNKIDTATLEYLEDMGIHATLDQFQQLSDSQQKCLYTLSRSHHAAQWFPLNLRIAHQQKLPEPFQSKIEVYTKQLAHFDLLKEAKSS